MENECDVCGQQAKQFAAISDDEQMCTLCLVNEIRKTRESLTAKERRIEYLEGHLTDDPIKPKEIPGLCKCGHYQHDGKCPIGRTDTSTGYKTVYCDCQEFQPF